MTTEIGSVINVKISAFGTPVDEDKRSLAMKNGVFADRRVDTVASSGETLAVVEGAPGLLGAADIFGGLTAVPEELGP